MNETMIKVYSENKSVSMEDIFLLRHVGIDNVRGILNRAFKGFWSYEITSEVIDIASNTAHMTIQLYVPGRSLSGIASINKNEDELNYRKNLVNAALLDACMCIAEDFEDKGETTEDTNKTIEEDKEVKEINKELENIKTSSIEELEREAKKVEEQKQAHQKNTAFRKDQIDYLNKFKAENNIDNDSKFDYYVRVWNDSCNTGVSTKRELVTAGPKALDAFIAWLEKVKSTNIENQEVNCPI